MTRPAADPGADALAELQARLGHRFADPALLQQALSHSSLSGGRQRAAPRAFDRLEFLGDRVLGLFMAEILVETFPRANEGELGRRFAALVSYPSLAGLAAELELGPCLRLSPSEEQSGGRRNPSVLADAFEALLGALYLDGGADAARRVVRAHFTARAAREAAPPREPKTALQEWLQGRGLGLPSYRVVTSEGPAHAPHFVVEAQSGSRIGRGEGASKREAERAAAEALLAQLEGS